MRLLVVLLLGLLYCQQISSSSATTNTLSRGQALAGDEKLVSSNGKFALGFFQTGSKSSSTTLKSYYLGIWFHKVPKLTPVWTANGESPISDPASSELIISEDGNLVVKAQGRIIWSAEANVTTKDAIAVLMDNGNLVLQSSLNTSAVYWQSFDYPTDTFMMEAKLGINKVTGLNRRLVSRKNSIDQASGVYSMEFSLDGIFRLLWNSSISYWSSGEWNGRFFSSVPEMAEKSDVVHCNYTFVNNDQEVYFSTYCDRDVVFHNFLGVSGLWTNSIWLNQDWVTLAFHPQRQCDVHAACGPFAVCIDNANPFCNCMKSFSVRSPQDWGLGDTNGGCVRNTPLSFCSGDKNETSMRDKFYPMPSIRLPDNGEGISNAMSAKDCAEACLQNCSCTAYSYGKGGCFVWHDDLLNVVVDSNGEILYLRLAAEEVHNSKSNNRSALIIGVATSTGIISLGLVFLIVMWRRKGSWSSGTKDSDCGIGVTAFKYTELRRATKNFSEKLGEGGFGSVFKGSLTNSVVIAVKRLDRVHQGEKQFRAEVSSIGIIQHINLVKLIGFCCEDDKRLLVYEFMPNRSLDAHLFQTQGTSTKLDWRLRYQIALGVARGLAYLHHSCRDCIIHCDIKPQNILLDASFLPKIADFGMAKFLGRDFNRVMTTMRGTIGYIAPEWISGTAITSKVDVYSYGKVLLEIISGKRNSDKVSCSDNDHEGYFPVQVAHKLLDGDVTSLVDANLHGDVKLEEVERVCKVACWCIQDNEFDRPTMSEVVQYLEGVSEPNTPPMPRLLHAITTRRHQESAVKDVAASTFQSRDST